jgi:hypothetical protein
MASVTAARDQGVEDHMVHARSVAAAAIALILVSAGCSRPFQVRVEDNAAALTGAQAERLAAQTDISSLTSVSTTDSVAMRAQVVADLRTRGALGARAADLLTTGFPPRTASVPVLVRGCKVDGVDAVLVVEAFGSSSGGMLTHRRLWVFDRATGALLRAASVR